MGRGIVESGLFRSERYELEVRTSDPAFYEEGDWWIRGDIAPDTDQIATWRFADSDSTTADVPIYTTGTAGSNVSEAVRVPIAGNEGYIPITDASATFSYLRAQHSGAQYAFHDAKSVIAIPDSGVARWTFDTDDTDTGTAIDVWNGNDGTINGATTGVSGANVTYTTNEAYSFDGTDDYVSAPSLGISGSVSLAVWVKTSDGSNQRWIGGAGYGSNGEHHAIATNINTGGEWALILDDGETLNIFESSGSSFSDGTWTFLCPVYDASSGDVILYEGDANSVGTGTYSGGSIQPEGPFEIGRQPNNNNFYFSGDADDPRAYSKALSSTEVSNLYNTGSI